MLYITITHFSVTLYLSEPSSSSSKSSCNSGYQKSVACGWHTVFSACWLLWLWFRFKTRAELNSFIYILHPLKLFSTNGISGSLLCSYNSWHHKFFKASFSSLSIFSCWIFCSLFLFSAILKSSLCFLVAEPSDGVEIFLQINLCCKLKCFVLMNIALSKITLFCGSIIELKEIV